MNSKRKELLERKKILQELFAGNNLNLINSISQENDLLNNNSILAQEMWDGIIELINFSFNKIKNEWLETLRKEKLKILCYKYFTKIDLIDLENLEKEIRSQIKPYYSSLISYYDERNFMERFFNLPKNILFSFVRFIFNNSKELNEKISVSKEELKEKIEELKEQRKKVANKVSFISNGNPTTLDLTLIKELIDNGVFYENNFLNKGINEFFYKLVSNENSSEKIINSFNETFLKDLKKGIENSNSYISHVTSIKNEEVSEYFSDKGLQLGRRFDIEIDELKTKNFSDSIVDKESVFKEPSARIIKTSFPWNSSAKKNDEDSDSGTSSSSTSNSGGGFSGGGGGGSIGGDTFNLPSDAIEDKEGVENDGTEMPKNNVGLPEDFGTQEDNSFDTEEENSDEKEEKIK